VKKVATRCPKCDFDNTSDSKFCKECGTQLPASKSHIPEATETLRRTVKELARGPCSPDAEMTPDFRKICQRDTEYSYCVAQAFALLNEKKEALDWLENAVNRVYINYPFISKYAPFLDNIRGEERFKKFMERVKCEWEHFEE